MGLGDHFMCNGLIRQLIKPENQYILFVKKIYFVSVHQMYSDLTNLKLEVANTLEEIQIFLRSNLKYGDGQIRIGYSMPNFGRPVTTEEWFYLQHKLNPESKWTHFRSPRNHDRELALYNRFNINEDYVFVHDDNKDTHPSHRGPKTINDLLLPDNIRVIRVDPKLTDNIFDYCLLIERAKQVHCIESCFAFMVDLLNLNKLIIHEYPEPPIKNDGVFFRKDKMADWKNVDQIFR